MKKGEIAEGIISYVDFPDKGIIILGDDERKVVLKGGITGQKVRYRIQKRRNDRYEACIEEVIEKASIETREPVCKNYGLCGGCSYHTLPYEEQLKLKSAQVKKMLDRVITTDYEYEEILGSPTEWETRNKMEYAFGDSYKGGPMSLGLHKRGHFHDILFTDDCKIVNNDFNKILRYVFEHFNEAEISFYNKAMHRGYLRHLLVRRAAKTGEILVALETSSDFITKSEKTAMEMDSLKEFLASPNAVYDKDKEQSQAEKNILAKMVEKLRKVSLEGEIVGIIHLINNEVSDDVKAERQEILFGRDYINEELLGLKFKITTFSFFQTNSLGAEVLYSKVREYVGNNEGNVVYDLYSGTGTIGQIISPVAKKVIGIEIVEEAVVAANENAKLNGLINTEFLAGDVFKVLDEVEEKPDFIILDPPRDGVSPKALKRVLSYGVRDIVYIACKPTSLVRDILELEEAGYRVKKVCLCDMFPETLHVETVALLSKLDVDKHIDVEIKLDELDLTSAESKASYAQIKKYILEKFDLKVSTLYIAQIKKKCGIVLRENYNKSKKEKQVIPQCTPEKEEAIMDALRHFKMI